MSGRSNFTSRGDRRPPSPPPSPEAVPTHYVVEAPRPPPRPRDVLELDFPLDSAAAPMRDAAGVVQQVAEDEILDLLAPAPELAPRKRVARREERIPTNWIAMAHLPGGEEIPCNVKDISKSGAKVGIPEYVKLPSRFALRIIGRDFACQVVLAWRRGNYVGLKIENVYKLRKAAAA